MIKKLCMQKTESIFSLSFFKSHSMNTVALWESRSSTIAKRRIIQSTPEYWIQYILCRKPSEGWDETDTDPISSAWHDTNEPQVCGWEPRGRRGYRNTRRSERFTPTRQTHTVPCRNEASTYSIWTTLSPHLPNMEWPQAFGMLLL